MENEQTDFISRIFDFDDWMLDPVTFTELDHEWGPHTIDRFADMHNTQLDRFNLRYWNPGSEVVDAFTSSDWGEKLIGCVYHYTLLAVWFNMQRKQEPKVPLSPSWCSAPFWPTLYSDSQNPVSFMQKIKQLPCKDMGFSCPDAQEQLYSKVYPILMYWQCTLTLHSLQVGWQVI